MSVPERYRDGLREISNLTADALKSLVGDLEAAGTSEGAMRAVFDKHLESASAFDAVMSAAVLRSSHGMRARLAALEIGADLGDDFSAEALARVLEVPNLVLAAKTIDLSGTGERVLHTSRVVTDVRPLFDDGSDPKSLGSLVVHTLILTTFSTSGPEELFVTLDDDDLDTLRDQVTRALAKGEHVRGVLATTALKVVQEGEEDGDRS